jgi:hypothetical protein
LISLNGEFKIANPNEDFEETDDRANPNLPTRQLKLLCVKNNSWRMSYIQGGMASSYVLVQCDIKNNLLHHLQIAHSFTDLDNNDSITKYIKDGSLKLEDVEDK